MVLHLHMLSSSGPLGPTYVSPGSKGSMVNAAGDEAAKLINPRGTLTAPAACGLQVCGHLARILIERIIRLDKLRQGRVNMCRGFVPNYIYLGGYNP